MQVKKADWVTYDFSDPSQPKLVPAAPIFDRMKAERGIQ